MDRLGIEHLSVSGLPRLELVELAADLGCRHISTNLATNPYGKAHYPPYSLRDDVTLRREMIATMRDRDVSISLGEGMIVWAERDIRDSFKDLDVLAELGVRRINSVSFEPDLNRSIDQFGLLAAAAAEMGMEMTIEPCPTLTVSDLPTAIHVIEQVGRPDFRLLVDSMHVIRSGAAPGDFALLDPDMIGYIQLSDAPLTPRITDYMEEAMVERLLPGEGELPLSDLLSALPRDAVVGLEIPLAAEAQAGISAHDRLRRGVDAARMLLSQLD